MLRIKFIYLFLILLFGCNVGEQTPVENNSTQQSSSVQVAVQGKSNYFFNNSVANINENATQYVFYLKRDGDTFPEEEVFLQVSGKATSSDWNKLKVDDVTATIIETDPLTYSIKFNKNEKKKKLEVSILEDNTYELSENLNFSLLEDEFKSYNIKFPSMLTINILNEDSYPEVSFNVSSPSIAEGDDTDLEIQITNPSDFDVKVPIQISGSANSSDHDFSEPVITIAAGDTSATFNIAAETDGLNELDETLILTLGNPIGAKLAATNTSETITITDASADPELNFQEENDCSTALGAPTITENAGSYILTLCLNTSTYEEDFEVPFTVSGTALKNVDYTLSDNRFRFDNDATNPNKATITLATKDDLIYEGDETVILTIADHAFASAGATNTMTVNLTENEVSPVVSFSSGNYQTQEGVNYYLNISLNNASSSPLTRYLCIDSSSTATYPADHNLVDNLEITIPEGTITYQHPVFIKNDSTHDPNETLIISMDDDSDCSSPSAAQTITIRNQGTIPTLQFTASTLEGSEGDTIQVNLELDKASGEDQDFSVSIQHVSSSSADITTPSLTNTITAGDTSVSFDIPLTTDSTDEPNEQFVITLSQPSNLNIGEKFSQVVTIIDTSPEPVAALSVNTNPVLEASGTTDFTVTLDQPSAFDLAVPYTIFGFAELGEDYTLDDSTGYFYIPAGETTKTISATIIDDGQYDPNESIIFAILEGDHFDRDSSNLLVNVNITENKTVPTINMTTTTSTVNENDIASFDFELDWPTYDDINVTYEIDFTDCTTPAADEEDLQVNTDFDWGTATGTITIPKGNTKGVINITILSDGVYELGSNECFHINLLSSSNTARATIGTSNQTRVSIVDINAEPEIYFNPSNKSLTATEGTPEVLVPIYLSSKTGEDITFLISAREAGESAYPADANDFDFIAGDERSSSSSANQIIVDNGLTSYTDLETIEVTVKKGNNIAYIPISLKSSDDALYEGTEIIELVIARAEGDDTSTAYSIRSDVTDDGKDGNVFTFSIQDDEPYPQVSIYFDDDNTSTLGTLHTEWTQNEGNLDDDDPTNADNIYQEEFIVMVEPMLQHESAVAYVSFGGDAERALDNTWDDAIFNFNLYDYHVMYNGLYKFSEATQITISPNTQYESFYVSRHRDVRYEEDETIIPMITSSENSTIGSQNQVEYTIENDDDVPELYFHFTPPSIEEGDYSQYPIITVRDSDYPSVYFEASSEIDINFNLNINANYRNTTGSKEVNVNYTLQESSGSYAKFEITPELLGDLRLFDSIDFKIQTLQSVNIGPSWSPFYIWMFVTEASDSVVIEIPDMVISTSKGSFGSGGEVLGHTCMAYRGLVTCFGNNQYGQLGKNDTNNWGETIEDVLQLLNQEYTIDLGKHEEYDVPLYVKHIALGKQHTCVSFSNEKIKCWGRNDSGQLGLGISRSAIIGDNLNEVGPELEYVDIGSTSAKIKGLYAMDDANCAWLTSGIKCWGNNLSGRLGTNDTSDWYVGDSPEDMGEFLQPVDILSVKLFDTGSNHACALTYQNTLKCWGSNAYGRLGLNSSSSNLDPNSGIVDIDDEGEITSISAGEYHTCVTFDSDTYSTYNTRCWGSNVYGELGLGRVTYSGVYSNDNYDMTIYSHSGSDAVTKNSIVSLGDVSTQDEYEIPLKNDGFYSENPHEHPDIGWLYYLSVGFSRDKNQFVEIRQPASKVESNSRSTCGVYTNYLKYDGTGDTANENHIRCWGSNFYTAGGPETGILNNVGWDEDFDGTYRGSNVMSATIATCGASCSGDNWWSTNWISSYGVIGDESYDEQGDPLFSNHHPNAASFYYGYTNGIFNVSEYANFELNYIFNKVKDPDGSITFQNYEGLNGEPINDIDLAGGGHHMCALPKSDGTDNAFICWGANWDGQAAHWNDDCGVVIGGKTNCSSSSKPVIWSLNWSFLPE